LVFPVDFASSAWEQVFGIACRPSSPASSPTAASAPSSKRARSGSRSRPATGQIQPASLDLRLGDKAYRVRASFLPGPDRTVQTRLDALALHEIDLTRGAVLETGCVYVAELMEGLAMPAGLRAAANPKSSTGRLDVFTRVITDRAREFDLVEDGYEGPLFIEISPRTFPVLVRSGSRLSQIRFRAGETRLDDKDLARCISARRWSARPSPPSRAASPSVSISRASTG
jgi:dCTP deaminase